MVKNCEVIFVALVGILCCIYTDCTSTHNLHNLLRHPHYAEGHQHALQHHLQHSTSHPSRKLYDGRVAFPSPYSAPLRIQKESTNEEDSSLGPWSRTVTKDYYKMNGYNLKSTSATKSAMVIDPQIPQELSEVREANEHFVRMRLEAGCKIPRPQVVCVRDVYPGKNILPRCTMLHRCTEVTGCCEDEKQQCSPKAMQELAILFYVLGGDHRSTNVEKLLFANHTECECQSKPNNVTTTVAPTTTTTISTTTLAPKMNENHFPLGDQKYNKCRSCPSPFHSRELEDGICSCDCFDRHKPCIRVKRGREALSDAERRCVLAGHCNIPECDYGGYDPERGRCPKRPDQEGFKGSDPNGRRPVPNHKNPNHRWTYFERD